MQKLPGVFGAEMGPGGNFATKKAFFGAELGRRRGFATKKAFFGAESMCVVECVWEDGQFCGKILQICLPGTSGATFFLFLELLFFAFEICIKFLRSLP